MSVFITISMLVTVDFIMTIEIEENHREVPNIQEYEELEPTHTQGSQVQHQFKKDRDAQIKKCYMKLLEHMHF